MVYKFSEYSINEAKKDTSNFKLIYKMPAGSTGAYLYEDGDGSKWIVKFGASEGQMWNEYTANKVYEKGGVKVPDAYVGTLNNRPCLITQFLEDSIPLGYYRKDPAMLSKACKGFILDVITANWDVIGENDDMDNVRVWNNEPYRVDVGGSMLYRAMGDRKDHTFGKTPSEQNTLRDKVINRYGAEAFAEIDDKYLRKEMAEYVKKYVLAGGRISYMKLVKDIHDAVYDKDNEMKAVDKKTIFKRIAQRAINLYKIFN